MGRFASAGYLPRPSAFIRLLVLAAEIAISAPLFVP